MQVFLHMAVVRLKGQVMGYLTPDIGIIEVRTDFLLTFEVNLSLDWV
jgi:hypothetical protein